MKKHSSTVGTLKQAGQTAIYLLVLGGLGVALFWMLGGQRTTETTTDTSAQNYLPQVAVQANGEQTIEGVVDLVNGYCDSNDIKGQGLCNSLLAKLNAAIDARDRGQPDVACNQLNAFINEVEAQNDNKIAPAAATALIDAANGACAALPQATPTVTSTPAYSYPITIGTVTIIEYTPQPTSTPTPTPEPLNGQPIGGYVFSTAQPLTNVGYFLFEWISKNEIIVIKNYELPENTLEKLDVTTGNSQIYSDDLYIRNPAWLSEFQQMSYLTSHANDYTRQYLNFSNGTNHFTKTINFALFSPLVPTFDGQGIWFFDENWQLQQINILDGQQMTFSIDTTIYKPSDYRHQSLYHASLSPDKSKIVYYNTNRIFLIDTIDNSLEELDVKSLGTQNIPEVASFFDAKWNAQSNRIAILTEEVGTTKSQLFVFDINSKIFDFIPHRLSYITGLSWAPDNDHLMILGKTNPIDAPKTTGAMFLINTTTKNIESVPALPQDAIIGERSLSWSPTGHYLLVRFATQLQKSSMYIVNVIAQ